MDLYQSRVLLEDIYCTGINVMLFQQWCKDYHFLTLGECKTLMETVAMDVIAYRVAI